MHHKIKSAIDKKDEATFLSLLKQGFNIEPSSDNGKNALIHCVINRNITMLECIIKNTNLDINSEFKIQKSKNKLFQQAQPAINLALYKKDKDVVNLLLDNNANTHHDDTFFFALKECKDIDIINRLIEKANLKLLNKYKKEIVKEFDKFKTEASKIKLNVLMPYS